MYKYIYVYIYIYITYITLTFLQFLCVDVLVCFIVCSLIFHSLRPFTGQMSGPLLAAPLSFGAGGSGRGGATAPHDLGIGGFLLLELQQELGDGLSHLLRPIFMNVVTRMGDHILRTKVASRLRES